MITPQLLAKVSEHLDKAVNLLMSAANEVRDAWYELLKRNVDTSCLGVFLANAEKKIRNVITELDTLVHTWEVLRHAEDAT